MSMSSHVSILFVHVPSGERVVVVRASVWPDCSCFQDGLWIEFFHMGGAVGRVQTTDTAFVNRDADYEVPEFCAVCVCVCVYSRVVGSETNLSTSSFALLTLISILISLTLAFSPARTLACSPALTLSFPQIHSFGRWTDPSLTPQHVQFARTLGEALKPYALRGGAG